MLSSNGSSQPRDQTQISHIANKLFTVWATSDPTNSLLAHLYLCSIKFFCTNIFFLIFFLLLIDFKDFPVCQQSTSSSVYYVLILFNFLLFIGMILVLFDIFSGPQKR